MKPILSRDALLHHSMALVGGFFGGYAILCRMDCFGSAQTSNLINLVLSLLRCDPVQLLIRVGCAALYALATALSVLIPRYTKWDLRRVSMLVDAGAAVILSLLPKEMDLTLALYPIFFAMSLQWNSFTGADGFVSSTIFSTNNWRQLWLGITTYCCTKEPKQAEKAVFFGGTLVFFHVGVTISFFAVQLWGIPSAVCAVGLVAAIQLGVRN